MIPEFSGASAERARIGGSTEREAGNGAESGITKIGWSDERRLHSSRSAHMLSS